MPTAISLFSGAGGCSLGFKSAGYDVLYANDIENSAVSSYKKNFPNTLIDNEDIAKIDFESVMKTLRIAPGELDILIGGPPCQGFSTAGSRFWDDPRNSLLKSYVSALSQIRPKWFLMENVEGLLTAKKGEYLLEALKAFISLGYNVRVDKIYAQEYGVPQRRKRVFIIGNLIGIDITLPAPLVNLGGAIFRNSDFTLRRAINGLPLARTDKNPISYSSTPHDQFEDYLRGQSQSVTLHTYKESSGIQLERISALAPGQTMKDIPEELQHESFKKRANRRVADGTPSEKRGGAPSGLKRLVYDEPCLTITGASTREFIHPEENRPLTIRECARIQTFPDSFEFLGNGQEITQQIGNAIPPLLAQHFANHFRNLGFGGQINLENRGLQCYSLTKADAMSPALNHTDKLLKALSNTRNTNLNLF